MHGWLPGVFEGHGETALTIAGSVLSFIFTAIWGTLVMLWKSQKKRMDNVDDNIDSLCTSLRETRNTLSDQTNAIKDSVLSYRSEIIHLKAEIEPLRKTVSNIEGAVKNQNVTINNYVEKVGEINGQLDSVFLFIEQYPRSKIERLR